MSSLTKCNANHLNISLVDTDDSTNSRNINSHVLLRLWSYPYCWGDMISCVFTTHSNKMGNNISYFSYKLWQNLIHPTVLSTLRKFLQPKLAKLDLGFSCSAKRRSLSFKVASVVAMCGSLWKFKYVLKSSHKGAVRKIRLTECRIKGERGKDETHLPGWGQWMIKKTHGLG